MDAIVVVYTHHFTVKPLNTRMIQMVFSFSRQYLYRRSIYGKTGNILTEIVKQYASADRERTVFRFHYNGLEDFKKFLKDRYITTDQYSIEYLDVPQYDTVEYKLHPHFQPRPYQVPVIDYIVDPEHPRFKLLALNTGEGKTISSFFAMEKMKVKTIVIERPGYIDRWLDEIKKVFVDIKVMTVAGTANLQMFMKKVRDRELEYDIALVSNKTMQLFITAYEKYGNEVISEEQYICPPQEFFQTVRAGFRIIDEVHQDFHFNFKLDLYTHIAYSLSLSATLVNKETFIEEMYQVAYPKELRYHSKIVHKFVKATCVYFSINEKYHITSTRRGTSLYSQTAYEESLMRITPIFNDFKEMVSDIVRDGFINDMEKGDKLIIFAGTVKMCAELTHYLRTRFKEVSINKYTAEDDYSNLIDSDIRITTMGSGGTAHDIPNLTTIIKLVSLDSVQSNLQLIGRLRDIPGKDIKYIYLVDETQSKQVIYHRNAKKILSNKIKSMRQMIYPKHLGGKKIGQHKSR